MIVSIINVFWASLVFGDCEYTKQIDTEPDKSKKKKPPEQLAHGGFYLIYRILQRTDYQEAFLSS